MGVDMESFVLVNDADWVRVGHLRERSSAHRRKVGLIWKILRIFQIAVYTIQAFARALDSPFARSTNKDASYVEYSRRFVRCRFASYNRSRDTACV